MQSHGRIVWESRQDIRGKVAALAGEDGDVDVLALGNLPHSLGDSIITIGVKGVELLLIADSNCGNAAGERDLNGVGHDGRACVCMCMVSVYSLAAQGSKRDSVDVKRWGKSELVLT